MASGIAEEKLVYLHGSASCFGSALYCDEPEFAQSDQHRVGFREAFAMAQVRNPSVLVVTAVSLEQTSSA